MAQPLKRFINSLDDLRNAALGVPPPTVDLSPSVAAPPEPTASSPHDLEACATEILKMLPTHIAEYIREIAYVYNRQPLWSIVAGHCLKAYENGDIQAPILDPSWPRRFPDMPADPRAQTYVCDWVECAKPFTPVRYKQRFCSQACGAAAQKAVFATAGGKV